MSHHEVVVVGGGQAGLSVSYGLKTHGIEHVVLERTCVASSWRTQRWDTFCLVTPNWQCQLPGYPYRGSDPHGFMGRDEIVEYVEGYAASFGPPLIEGVEVLSVRPPASDKRRFELETSVGPMTADHVVVATGAYHVPRIPAMSRELPGPIVQLHSAHYRNPAQLPPGEVLVVGTGQSGCQIAEDLHLAGRTVHLCVGNAPRCARRHRGKDVVEWLHRMGYYDIPIERHPNREQVRDRTNHYVTGRDGGRDIDLRRFALEGMRLYGPLKDIRSGRVEFAPGLKRNLDDADDVYRSINRSIDEFIAKQGILAAPDTEYVPCWEPTEEVRELDAARLSAVVWCVGFASDFGWIHAPVFDEGRYPLHERGGTAVDGLYFIGLPWLYTWGSGRFSGVGRDAEHIASRIGASIGGRSRAGGLPPRVSVDTRAER
jgi:putative flavoprotein involved in K+ transport